MSRVARTRCSISTFHRLTIEPFAVEKTLSVREMKSRFQTHCGSLYFLKVLFMFGSFTLMMPYRIVYRPQTTSYIIQPLKYRRILICVLQILLTIQLIIVVLHGLVADHSFKSCIIGTINFLLMGWANTTLFTLVKKKQKFLIILEQVELIGRNLKKWGAETPKRCKVIAIVVLLCSGSVLISLLEILFLELKFHLHSSSSVVYDLLIRRAKYILYCISNKGSYEFLTTTQNSTLSTVMLVQYPGSSTTSRYQNTGELIFGSFSLFVIKFYYLNVGHFGYITIFIFTLMLSQLFRSLNSSIPNEFHDSIQVEKVIQLYRDLCDLTSKINDAIGTLVAWGILVHLPYNAYKTKDLLLDDAAKHISYLIHIVMYGGILLVGANVQSTASSIVDKIATNKLVFANTNLHSRVSLLLHQVATNRVGLLGANLFQITYGFFGNIVGVILTYAILIAQFQSHCT